MTPLVARRLAEPRRLLLASALFATLAVLGLSLAILVRVEAVARLPAVERRP